MKKITNSSVKCELYEPFCRFDLYASDGCYLFTLLVNPITTIIQLPVHLPHGRYFWKLKGGKTEKNGTFQLLETHRINLVLEREVVADL
jgi:hypothetical protein